MKSMPLSCLLSLGLSLSFTANSAQRLDVSQTQVVGRYARLVGDTAPSVNAQPFRSMDAVADARMTRAIALDPAKPSPWLCKSMASGQFRCAARPTAEQ